MKANARDFDARYFKVCIVAYDGCPREQIPSQLEAVHAEVTWNMRDRRNRSISFEMKTMTALVFPALQLSPVPVVGGAVTVQTVGSER